MLFDISASIVGYRNKPEMVMQAISSFLNTSLNVKLYLVDNSPDDSLKTLCGDPRCEYIFNGANLGFGRAHNLALARAVEVAKYHIVLNPDIYFERGVLEKIFNFMESNSDVAQTMPQIRYSNGEIQYLCKLLPSPKDLFLRRFLPGFPGAARRNKLYQLEDSGYDKIMNIPNLSGCFMFLRTSALKDVGFFDEKIFMYIEDTDITRRMHLKYRTIFFPDATVYHHFAKGSYKNFRLLVYHIHGTIIYFTKWGWLFDSERKRINKNVINLYINNK